MHCWLVRTSPGKEATQSLSHQGVFKYQAVTEEKMSAIVGARI